MQSGKRLTSKDYFAKHSRTPEHKNHNIVNCQVQLFLDNMVLANQNAKLTGPDQGFLVSRLVLI
jgi:sulfur transfer protein SufE